MYITQHNCEALVGLVARRYLRLARRKAFPSTKIERDVVARIEDVRAFVESRIQLGERAPVNDTDPEAIAFAKVGARRVGA